MLLACVLSLSSQAVAVTQTANTDNDLWVDDTQHYISEKLDQNARHLDARFISEGDDSSCQNIKQTGTANLRLLVDSHWNKYAGFNTNVRLRGRLHLPHLNCHVNIVFGDDSLDDEDPNHPTASNSGKQPHNNQNQSQRFDENLKHLKQQALDDNAALALRASLAKQGYETDFDLGVRSGTDIYTRAGLKKNWQLTPITDMLFTQTLRYGSESKFYSQSRVDIAFTGVTIQPVHLATHLDYSEPESQLGMQWGQDVYQSQLFSNNQELTYGININGHSKNHNIDNYGAWFSYRQPVWREWFFVQFDGSYVKSESQQQDWHPVALLRLETHF